MYKNKLYGSKDLFYFYSNFRMTIFYQVEYNSNKIYKGQTFAYYLSILWKCLIICKSQKLFANSIEG